MPVDEDIDILRQKFSGVDRNDEGHKSFMFPEAETMIAHAVNKKMIFAFTLEIRTL